MAVLVSRLTATFAGSASISDALTINGGQVAVIEMPSAWTPAVITFMASVDGTNYFDVYHEDGSLLFVYVEPSRRVHVDIPALSQMKYIKLQSGTATTKVLQASGRTVYVEIWK